MSHPITVLGATSRRLVVALLLTTCAIGCSGGGAPTAPTPPVIPIAMPTPLPVPTSPGTMFGVVSEVTAAGRTPVEGVRLSVPELRCNELPQPVDCGPGDNDR